MGIKKVSNSFHFGDTDLIKKISSVIENFNYRWGCLKSKIENRDIFRKELLPLGEVNQAIEARLY